MSGIFEKAIEEVVTEEDIERVRQEFLAAAKEEADQGRTLPKMADPVGVAYATLHAWTKGTYNGDNLRVARKIHGWLLNRAARAQTRATVRAVPDFLMTTTASRIFDTLEYAQSAPEMVLISMDSGLGKTMAVEAYQKRAPNAWLLTAEPSFTTPGTLLAALGMALGMERGGGTVYRMSYAIQHRLRGTEGLIVVDEAQHMSPEVRDQLRQTVYDGAKIGVALVGNETLNATFGRERSTGRNAQLISRIGQRLSRERPFKSDVELLLDSWKITKADVREKALGIALKPGALRQMTKALRIACALSDARGDEEPSSNDIDSAWKQLGGAI